MVGQSYKLRGGCGRTFLCTALGTALGTALVLAGAVTLVSRPVFAETLPAALSIAYVNNPTLRADRARQRATDESVPQALSGWRPSVVARGDAGRSWQDTNVTPSFETNPAGASIVLSQPVFEGFKTLNSTKQAEAGVRAGRQNLLATEQTVLLAATTAFMNVIRDRQIVRLREKNVQFLTEQLRASQARFNVGEITRTDVAQSQARLALSRSSLSQARATLAGSIATYTRVIGRVPGRLRFPPPSRRLPKTLGYAIRQAERINPTILAAAFNEEAARHNIKVVKGDLLPVLTFEAEVSKRNDPSRTISDSEDATIRGSLTVPLYQAGRVHSQIRQAKQVASQRRLEILGARREVREAVVQSWHLLVAARQTITSARSQVSANRLALDGVKQEALVGSRTTLDVLDAEQELVDSQVSLVTAQRDHIVTGYQLLAAVGKMTAASLGLSVATYDPADYYREVRDKFIGTSVKTVE